MESWHKVYQIRRLCGTPTSEIAHYTLDLHSRPVSHLVAYSFFILLCVTLQYIVSLKLKYHYAYHYYVCFSRSPSEWVREIQFTASSGQYTCLFYKITEYCK